ncbi:Major Facilitator Superfamily protein [Faunimonas pinastri]|uniref:Major Facilitator Superfamily protein n=1 Tax=Faunimonas pinastri TaxID=1855383 RepID=A0A1H9EL94_9HYPH|nr:MFS transporter [Faunimonas pinastri]SEQ26471.1 Major Facilitator Superfamily protein [Faunimonas pinastri]
MQMPVSASAQEAAFREQSVAKVAFASLIGTFIEFYDYFIYGAAAALVFPKLFFSTMPPAVATIVSFATLGVTFITRPLGALIFGHYGDTVGRKAMLLLSLTIMGLSTFAIGLLPGYATLGIAAPILLVVIRLLQGVAVGGEWGGATTMIIEYAPERLRGFFGSFVQLGNVFGLLVSTGAFALVSAQPEQWFLSWGWRLPFLASLVLLLAGLFIRMKIQEPPAFERLKQENATQAMPIRVVLSRYRREILLAAGMRIGENVLGYLIISWVLSYATTRLGFSRAQVLEGVMLGAASGIVTFPLFGWLSDKLGRRAVFLFGAVGTVLYAFPFFWLMQTGSAPLLQLALVIGYGGFLAPMYALQPSYFSELFATDIRYTGVSLGCQLASIIGGFTPMVAAALLTWANNEVWPISIMLVVAGLLTAICVLMAGETYQRRITE